MSDHNQLLVIDTAKGTVLWASKAASPDDFRSMLRHPEQHRPLVDFLVDYTDDNTCRHVEIWAYEADTCQDVVESSDEYIGNLWGTSWNFEQPDRLLRKAPKAA